MDLPDLAAEDWSSLSPAEQTGWSALLASLTSEAQLNTVGKLFARIELLRALKARRWLLAATEGHEREGIQRVFIIGAPRNGTSALIRALSNVKGAVAARTHEILDPATIALRRPDIVQSFTVQDRMWDAASKEFTHQHLNRADLPSECLPILSAGFQSPHWTGCYSVPAYRQYLHTFGYGAGLRFHGAFSDLLALHNPGQLQVFKSPAYGPIMSDLHQYYRGAKFIFIDSEPARPVASHIRLIENIRRMRSDNVNPQETLNDVVADFCDMYGELGKGIETGTLNRSNFHILDYADITSTTDSAWWGELLEWLSLRSPDDSPLRRSAEGSLPLRLEPLRLTAAPTSPEIAGAIVSVGNARRPFVTKINDTFGKIL